MNDGKICISVSAANAVEFIESINRAELTADVIELRFDCLQKNELKIALEKFCALKSKKIFLLTFRPAEQGGKRSLSVKERELFWSSADNFSNRWADVETDFAKTVSHSHFEKIICSQHDFNFDSKNLVSIYENLKKTNADVIKIAAQTGDISDSLAVWKLLEKAKAENIQIIPIAMGESGKWTRILGLAHGAFMTYAALDAGKETAPGQISARDLIEVYRVKELNENTEVYGVIGGDTTYSMSPYVHNAAFKYHKLNAVFVPLQVRNLDEFIKRMVKPETREIELDFKGFAVTIPHKQAIIKHLDYVDESVKAIGAVNTVKIENGKLYGYNTDADGFIEPLKAIFGNLKNAAVAVCGAGGAARACVYALKKEGAAVTIFARNLEKAKHLAEDFKVEYSKFKSENENYDEFDVLINATPLGTKGEFENQSIAAAKQIKNIKLVYDLIYNPFQTKLLNEADEAEIPKIGGMAMLVAQAARQQKIWTNLDAPIVEMSRAILQKLS